MGDRSVQFTDISGTITAGGTAQTVAPLDTARKYLRISNPANLTTQNIAAAESLWVNDKGVAAVVGPPSIEVVPGGVYEPLYTPCNAISVIAATTGHAFEGAVGQ